MGRVAGLFLAVLVTLTLVGQYGATAPVLSVGFAYPGVDVVGTYISHTTASSALSCASLCDLNAQCVAWSYSSCVTTNACALLSNATGYTDNNCTTCNAKVGEVGVDRAGTNITGYNPYVLPASSTASLCANLCANVSTCVAWSFDTMGRQQCWLRSTIELNTTINAARTSGIQGMINTNSPYDGIDTIILPANATSTQCAEFCARTPGCKVWLWRNPGSTCNNNNTRVGMCWAKTKLYYGGNYDVCFTAGKQPISTVQAQVPNIITPVNITSGLPTVSFPFKNMVAFGDNLSDNGNGSYAHCVAAPGHCNNSIYGFRTWTDGPVAVSYLATYLNISLDVDYAFGHADGGSKFGATIDNNYTNSTARAPSLTDQIANYTTTTPGLSANINNTFHFVWIGANDINLDHIDTSKADNPKFAANFSSLLTQRVQTLITAGAQYVFVPNLYPKHVSPSVTFYAKTPTGVANLGAAILQANNAIKASLAQFGSKVIYHDTYTFMLNVYNNSTAYGITHINGEYCDGYSQLDWELCVTDGQGDAFYWMQYLDMTSYVHNLVAADMYATIVKAFSS